MTLRPKPTKSLPLILASASPRRRALLKEAGIAFQVIPSRMIEPPPGNLSPAVYTRRLALAKAKIVAQGMARGRVLAADTIVVLRGEILGKPEDFRQGCQFLNRLQGTTHRVVTAVALVDAETGKTQVKHAVSHVTMRRLTPEEIVRHAQDGLDKAGGYAVQEKKDPIVAKVKGSYTNVVGLPMEAVKELLKTKRVRPSRV